MYHFDSDGGKWENDGKKGHGVGGKGENDEGGKELKYYNQKKKQEELAQE